MGYKGEGKSAATLHDPTSRSLAPVSMSLKELQYGSDAQSLGPRLSETVDGLARIFRQSLANDGFTFWGMFKFRNTDLNRVSDIINEIDSRAVFYTSYEDELPLECVGSIQDTRKEVRELARGVWADSKQQSLIQELQTALSDFIIDSARIDPFPKNHHDAGFGAFVSMLVDLRFRVWAVIAALKIKNGKIIQPAHLPPEILVAVQNALKLA